MLTTLHGAMQSLDQAVQSMQETIEELPQPKESVLWSLESSESTITFHLQLAPGLVFTEHHKIASEQSRIFTFAPENPDQFATKVGLLFKSAMLQITLKNSKNYKNRISFKVTERKTLEKRTISEGFAETKEWHQEHASIGLMQGRLDLSQQPKIYTTAEKYNSFRRIEFARKI